MPEKPQKFLKKKSLGQNFLKSEKALSQIIEASNIQPDDNILEIGPGEGALTEKILEKLELDRDTDTVTNTNNISIELKGHLTLIEKDDRLIPILEEKFKKEIESGILDIVHKDILEVFESGELSKNPYFSSLNDESTSKSYKIIANIPYYITGAIMRGVFELPNQPEKVVLLVQKEVADRIVAIDGKESILSASVKFYGTPRRVAVVPRGAFSPAPNVDSAIICIENIKKHGADSKNLEKAFFNVVKSAFAHKRKLLIKNLSESSKIFSANSSEQPMNWQKIFTNENIDLKARAEDISTEKYIVIAKHLI